MSKTKIVLLSIGSIVLLIVLAFALGIGGLQWRKFFEPRHAAVDREVFENTKSYTHGKMQDLAKYYEEYTKADTAEDKQAVAEVIKMQFAAFDANVINSPKLKQFLVNIRGF